MTPGIGNLSYRLLTFGQTQYRYLTWFKRVPPTKDICVSYGFRTVAGKDQIASGGIVKLQDLETGFPNHGACADILYLVSSALPPCALALARHAKHRGVSIVLNQNGTAYPAWFGPGWEKANRPMEALIRMADYVFYQSRFCKMAADRHLVARNQDYDICYNPVDTTTFVPANRPPTGHRLLIAGSHMQFYRVRSAIEALSVLVPSFPNIQLTIAGRFRWHPKRDQCKRDVYALSEKLQVRNRIHVSGAYHQQEAPQLFQEAHILLHTKYNDPCPRLVVEAMACGLPVVYSNSGGVPELVGQEAGIGIQAPLDWQHLHPPSGKALAIAVKGVFDDYNRFRHQARRRAVDRFDIKPWLARHRQVFRNLAARSRRIRGRKL